MTRKSRPGAERELGSDEVWLWRWITRHDESYQPEPDDDFLPPLLDVDSYACEQEKRQPAATPLSAPKQPSKPVLLPLQMGEYIGVDRKTAQRVKRGGLPVDVILDLHGSSQIEACERLYKCITRAHEQHKRIVLVITGKGRAGMGVLRQLVPQWLNDPIIRPFVLAFDQAALKDGAHGAYYVLLKRKR